MQEMFYSLGRYLHIMESETIMKQPTKGDIAICHQGHIGLILEGPFNVSDASGEYQIWRGIHLSDDKLGKNWLSKKPKVIGSMCNILEDLFHES